MSRPLTSTERILSDLREARGWYCGSGWYASFLPTFSQRISEINADYARERRSAPRYLEGAQLIVSRVCHQKEHQHKSTVHEYCLREFARPEQLRLVA